MERVVWAGSGQQCCLKTLYLNLFSFAQLCFVLGQFCGKPLKVVVNVCLFVAQGKASPIEVAVTTHLSVKQSNCSS